MNIVKGEGIILSLLEYREADLIVTLLTPQGKIRCIAHGARRSRKRFGGVLRLFARISTAVRPKEGLCVLEAGELLEMHERLASALEPLALAGYACELADALLPEGAGGPRIYRLLDAYLRHLDGAGGGDCDRRFYEINLLNILGYRPPVDDCAGCGKSFEARENAFFSSPDIVCSRCGRGATLSFATLELLRRCLSTGRFGVIDFPPAQLREAGEMLDALVALHVDKKLKSLRFLREMRGDPHCG